MSKHKDHKWIQGAIKRPGALRATASRMGILKGHDDVLSAKDMAKLKAKARTTGNTRLARQVALAKTLKGMHKGMD